MHGKVCKAERVIEAISISPPCAPFDAANIRLLRMVCESKGSARHSKEIEITTIECKYRGLGNLTLLLSSRQIRLIPLARSATLELRFTPNRRGTWFSRSLYMTHNFTPTANCNDCTNAKDATDTKSRSHFTICVKIIASYKESSGRAVLCGDQTVSGMNPSKIASYVRPKAKEP